MEEAVHHPVVPEFVCEFESLVYAPQGEYRARVYGIAQGTGVWDAWIIFFPVGDGPLMRTDKETEQASLEDLSIWARAVTPTYLQDAIERAHVFREEQRASDMSSASSASHPLQ